LPASLLAFLLLLMQPAIAQDDDDSDVMAQADEEEVEEITVTGSRLKRDTYSSISPLQVITGQISREVGLIDAGDILQESTASAGQQIDLTFQGFVLDNGPGATTVSLRGLGEARTLVLVNGRRLAPAGVEGAPFAANLDLVPASLVQQYDLLLDGASSVYGSDAVAGVANIILRKDFDGFELESYSRIPEHGGGVENTLSAVWGRNWDRGFIGVGAEFVDSERVTLEDRPWTAGCNRHHEITQETGEFRSEEQFYNNVYGMEWDDCRLGLLAGRVSVPFSGSIYYTPGYTNGGWPDFSESSIFGFGVDGNGDGSADVNFRSYDLNGKPSQQNSDLFPERQTMNFMAYGEYTFEGEANITPYFEVMYSELEFLSNSSEGQLFPTVPALNPFNICNAATPDRDCGLAYDALMNNPFFVQQVLNAFGCDPSAGGSCDQTRGAIGPAASVPIVSVAGDRNFTAVEGEQLRTVIGARMDLPFLNVGSLSDWSFDIYGSFSKSDAVSARRGIRGDRLDHALGWNSTTNTPCVNDTFAELAPDVEPGCVPVNLYAPSLYQVGSPGSPVTSDFATQAERDYLFDDRNFDTVYEQTIISAYVTGEIFELPAGGVMFGLGLETRNDEIKSIPDAVARDGLFFGFFSDGGATGEKDTDEIFAEVELPLLAGVRGFEELTFNASARYTDDELYGSGNTESFKVGWRPVESLLLRGTFGTSFRAPNLRENFLQAQSGFGNIFDPCFIPDDALDPLTGEYNPALDDREAQVLQNCQANGVDPTIANNNGFNVFSTEVARGGATDLFAEESESWSAGMAFDQPWTNAFDLAISATYYEIEVTNTIIEPSGQFIVNDCYNSLTGNSVFCSRITRDLSDPTFPVIDIIDSGFINREAEKARGVDVNLTFSDTWTFFERPYDITLDVQANRQLERSTLFVDDEGNEDTDTFQGEWGFPDWTLRSGIRVEYSDFRFTWETRYMSSVNQDPDGVDDWGTAFDISDTCGVTDDLTCRDYGDADNYFLNNVSLYYFGDRWTFGGGIRNVFDEEPPVVDGTEVLAINNTPIGYGYDINGRVYFVNIGVNFGGGE
jgi:iron complex outermembrane receptor protein